MLSSTLLVSLLASSLAGADTVPGRHEPMIALGASFEAGALLGIGADLRGEALFTMPFLALDVSAGPGVSVNGPDNLQMTTATELLSVPIPLGQGDTSGPYVATNRSEVWEGDRNPFSWRGASAGLRWLHGFQSGGYLETWLGGGVGGGGGDFALAGPELGFRTTQASGTFFGLTASASRFQLTLDLGHRWGFDLGRRKE